MFLPLYLHLFSFHYEAENSGIINKMVQYVHIFTCVTYINWIYIQTFFTSKEMNYHPVFICRVIDLMFSQSKYIENLNIKIYSLDTLRGSQQGHKTIAIGLRMNFIQKCKKRT